MQDSSKDIVYRRLIEEYSLGNYYSKEELYEDFLNNFHYHVVPFDGMIELLDYLKSIKVKIGLITNGGFVIQMNKIKMLGLESYCDVILISEKEGVEKPDSKIFRTAIDKLKVTTEDCLFVGDHPINDILGARNVGMKTAWKKNNQDWIHEYKPDFIFTELSELSSLLLSIPNIPNKSDK